MLLRMSVLCGCLLLIASFGSRAEMYKQIDEKGRVTYSNVPIKGAKKVDLQPISVVPGGVPGANESAPANASGQPVEDQDKGNASQRQALEESLANEEKLLAQAKQNLKEGEETPEVFKTTIIGKDGKPQVVTRRAVARYEEKVKSLQDEIALHEKNIEALKKELANLP